MRIIRRSGESPWTYVLLVLILVPFLFPLAWMLLSSLKTQVQNTAYPPVWVFTPTLNYSGRARFDFTVTDGDGSTWTQTLAVLVSLAVSAIAWLAQRGVVPGLAAWAMVVLAMRAAHGLSPWRPRWPTLQESDCRVPRWCAA